MARSENYQLEVFRKVLEELVGIGADVHPRLNSLSVREGDWNFEIAYLVCVVAMYQSLIQI